MNQQSKGRGWGGRVGHVVAWVVAVVGLGSLALTLPSWGAVEDHGIRGGRNGDAMVESSGREGGVRDGGLVAADWPEPRPHLPLSPNERLPPLMPPLLTAPEAPRILPVSPSSESRGEGVIQVMPAMSVPGSSGGPIGIPPATPSPSPLVSPLVQPGPPSRVSRQIPEVVWSGSESERSDDRAAVGFQTPLVGERDEARWNAQRFGWEWWGRREWDAPSLRPASPVLPGSSGPLVEGPGWDSRSSEASGDWPRWTLSGLIQGSGALTLSDSSHRTSRAVPNLNRPLPRPNGATLNQIVARLDLSWNDATADRFGLTAQLDGLMGSDAGLTRPGRAERRFPPTRLDQFDLPQARLDLLWPGELAGGRLRLGGGRFPSPFGIEGLYANERPLPSFTLARSFAQPLTLTGATLGWTRSDGRVTLLLGSSNGWDRGWDRRARFGFLGGCSVQGADGRTRWSLGAIVGPNAAPRFLPGRTPPGFRPGQEDPLANHSTRSALIASLSCDWTERVSQAFELTAGWEDQVPGVGRFGLRDQAQWFGGATWLTWTPTPTLGLVARGEVFRDDDGARTGWATTFASATLGLSWRPRPTWTLRPEFRYDYSDASADRGALGDRVGFALDAVVSF